MFSQERKERDMKRMLSGLAALAMLAGTGIAAADPYPYRDHDWRVGDRVDHDTWHRWHSVDWRRRHLHRPPAGYEWREYNGNFFQVAIGDGHIGAVVRVR
jgi:Ni/Co efflux regulator RcnB